MPRAGIVEELTGVRERGYKRSDQDTSDLACAAAIKAMASAGVTIDEIDPLERAIASGRAKPGDNVLWIGVGAGVSTVVMTTRL